MVDRSLFFYPEAVAAQPKSLNSHFEVASVSAGADLRPPATFNANDGVAKALSAMRHSTTQELINNIKQRAYAIYEQEQARVPKPPPSAPGTLSTLPLQFVFVSFTINIGGHGDKGALETGAGQVGPQTFENTVFPTTNWLNYAPEGYLSFLTYAINIYSCDTGAGSSGALFVFNMAKQFRTIVRARTGLMLVSERGEISFEEGSVWQEATYKMQQPPPPIESPQRAAHAKALTKQLMPGNLLLTLAPNFTLDLSLIQRITITVIGVTGRQEKEVQAAALLSTSQFIFAQPLFADSSEVAGLITAIIYIESLATAITIYVYNNRLGKIPQTRSALFIDGLSELITAL